MRISFKTFAGALVGVALAASAAVAADISGAGRDLPLSDLRQMGLGL